MDVMHDGPTLDYCLSLRLVQPIMGIFLEELNKRDPNSQISIAVVERLHDAAMEFLDAIRPSIAMELRSKSDTAFTALLSSAGRNANDAKEATYSIGFVRPFAIKFIEGFRDLDSDARIPIAVAHTLLDTVVEAVGDPDFGLKAGRAISVGDIGALDYAMSSAATVHEAIEVAARYIRLVNDGLAIRLDVEGKRAIVRLESQVVLPRTAEDFLLSAFYRGQSHRLLRDPSQVECWFIHAEPGNKLEYERTFAPAIVRFSAPCCGIVFDKSYLETPLESADSKLHSVLRKHADQMLSELPKTRNLTEKIRTLIANELPHGQPRIGYIARQLSMSARTLERRLESDGTTFTQLLDDLRRGLAQQYVVSRDLSLSEVAFLLGFSHSAAFHRAFKRWTGQTPLVYRRTFRK
jgi:AraC-like DNA-binding protein